MRRATGVVEFYKADKGLGFVRPDDGGKDGVVHRDALEGVPSKTLSRGDHVEFDMAPDITGWRAENVRKLDD